MYLMRKRGIEVIFAIATRGGKRFRPPFNRLLEQIRTRHQMRAARILGGIEVIFYDYPDGSLPSFIEPFARDVKLLIEERSPDIVFCWDPEFVSHPHPDHKAAADAVNEAALSVCACFYGAPNPNLWVEIHDVALRAKLKSIKAHATEAPWPYFDLCVKKWLLSWMKSDGDKIDCSYAESFRMRSIPRRPPMSL